MVQRLLPDLTSTAHDSEVQEETGDNPGCIADENKLCVSSRIEETREWRRQGFQGKSLSPQHAWWLRNRGSGDCDVFVQVGKTLKTNYPMLFSTVHMNHYL